MDNTNLKYRNHVRKNVYEIADIERAKKNKIYPAGCTLIPLSAAGTTPNKMTNEAGKIETRYAVLQPKEGVNPLYLFIITEREYPRFKERYITTINMQLEQLKQLYVDYHPDRTTQDEIAKAAELVEAMRKREEKVIENLKETKRYWLGTLFV